MVEVWTLCGENMPSAVNFPFEASTILEINSGGDCGGGALVVYVLNAM